MAKRDNKSALALLRQATETEDTLAYDEPPIWFLPVREMLGGALMKTGNYAEAEQVFRADLQRNKRNGRSVIVLDDNPLCAKYSAGLRGTGVRNRDRVF